MTETGAFTGRPAAAQKVFRHLPQAFHRAGAGSAAHALTRALGRGVEVLGRDAKKVLRAHFRDDLSDLDDAGRLAALLRLEPWPDEDLEAFRRRLRTMAPVYLRGAANARRLLTLVEVACGARPAGGGGEPAIMAPRGLYSFPALLPGRSLITDRFTTAALLRHELPAGEGDAEGELFLAAVEDLPVVEKQAVFEPRNPDGSFQWNLDNALYGLPEDASFDPPRPARNADPRIRIIAGTSWLRLPVVVQRDLRRVVLIHRLLPPGCVLELDLERRELHELSPPGAQSCPGPLLRQGAAAPVLLFGTGAVLDESNLSAPPEGVPAHVLRWYPEEQLAPGPGVSLAGDEEAPESLPWPGLLPLGTSHWSLLVGDRAGDSDLPLESLRLRHRRPGEGPERIEVRWRGRRPGTFTVRFDERHLSPEGDRVRRHRQRWLREQIERLKLAGVVFVAPEELAPAAETVARGELTIFELRRVGRSLRPLLADLRPAPPPMIARLAAGGSSATGTARIGVHDELELRVHRGSRARAFSERVRLLGALEVAAEGIDRQRQPTDRLAATDALGWEVERAVPRKISRGLEDRILTAETLEATAADLGRPQTDWLGLRDGVETTVDRQRTLDEKLVIRDTLEAKRQPRRLQRTLREPLATRDDLETAAGRGDAASERLAVHDVLGFEVERAGSPGDRLAARYVLDTRVERKRLPRDRVGIRDELETDVRISPQPLQPGGRDDERDDDLDR